MRSETASRLRMLLKLEFFFTILPAVVFPAALLTLAVPFPGAAFVVLTIGFAYLYPAFAIVNGLGYKTVEGPSPAPIPAGSLVTFLALIATHAALVAAMYLLRLAYAATSRWWDRVIDRA